MRRMFLFGSLSALGLVLGNFGCTPAEPTTPPEVTPPSATGAESPADTAGTTPEAAPEVTPPAETPAAEATPAAETPSTPEAAPAPEGTEAPKAE